MKNLLAKKDIKKKIKIALEEDFGKYGDITSKVLVSKKTKLKASIVAKEDAIVCGTEFAVQTFKALNSNCLLYTSPSPRDTNPSRMPSSA